MTTREVLEAARERISDESRWRRGTLEDPSGRVCALGAIIVTECGSVKGCGWRNVHLENHAAMEALAAVLPSSPLVENIQEERGRALAARITGYNDRDTTSHACVLAAFDAAIEKA
jgi:hypothetical protein